MPGSWPSHEPKLYLRHLKNKADPESHILYIGENQLQCIIFFYLALFLIIYGTIFHSSWLFVFHKHFFHSFWLLIFNKHFYMILFTIGGNQYQYIIFISATFSIFLYVTIFPFIITIHLAFIFLCRGACFVPKDWMASQRKKFQLYFYVW